LSDDNVGGVDEEDEEAGNGPVNVLVVVPEWAVGSARETSTMAQVAKRQRLEANTSLVEIWKRWRLGLEELPCALQLGALLERPLPFRLTLCDSTVSEDVFDPNGPLLTCAKLEALMNSCLLKLKFSPEAVASENSWQEYYDTLLTISTTLCLENKFAVLKRRNLADTTGTTQLRKRPDCILQHKGVVLMRGEEKRSLVPITASLGELTDKMRRWSVVFYGDLPYILGYATSGADLQMVAIERSDGSCRPTPILACDILTETARALKVFYNLAFLLREMSSLVKRSLWCDLVPFVPNVNEKRKIVLLDEVVERTITRSHDVSAADFERLVNVYKTLAELSAEGSPVTHLQTVEELREKNGRLIVELSPVGCIRRPERDEVSKWLRDILTALKHWHSRGYCHGDLRWRNIVFVPSRRSSYWVLIDMDESYQSNQAIIQWNHPCHGHYLRFQHDLYQLGELMNGFSLPDDMKNMKATLLSAIDSTELTAEGALALLAELCSGNSS
ncbi:hypothetical protein BBJ28_00026608, partial [Nothophytophthora sp. Chile5]